MCLICDTSIQALAYIMLLVLQSYLIVCYLKDLLIAKDVCYLGSRRRKFGRIVSRTDVDKVRTQHPQHEIRGVQEIQGYDVKQVRRGTDGR